MKSKIIIVGCALIALSAVSCKTTEKNYRDAYEIAKTSSPTESVVDPAIARLIEEEKRGEEKKVNGVDVRVKTEYFILVDPAKNATMPSYGVAVGSFKQIFNARSFRDRLIENKYPSFVIKDRSGQYYVIAKGFSNVDEAADYIKNISKNIPFKIPIEPFIVSTNR